MKHIAYIILLAGLLLLGASASSIASAAPVIDQAQSVSPQAVPNAQGCSGTPSIQYAYANPPTISAGQVTTLFWGLVGNANAAFLQHPNGHREGIGTPG